MATKQQIFESFGAINLPEFEKRTNIRDAQNRIIEQRLYALDGTFTRRTIERAGGTETVSKWEY